MRTRNQLQVTITQQKRLIAELREKNFRLQKYRAAAERRLETIRRLTRELAAEKRLTAAQARLAYAPAKAQKPGALKELKRAVERRDAA